VTGQNVAIALGSLQNEMAAPLTLVNEAISDAVWFQAYLHYDEPTSYFFAEGGSLGFSMPASLGFRLATGGDRTVVNVVGDGSALFYPHTWWTARKFDLPILYVITNNREYKTLLQGLELVKQIYHWSPSGDPWYLRLDKPPMSFVDLAAPFGIDGALVTRLGELEDSLRHGLKAVEGGQPFVVEVHTDPSLPPPAPAPRLTALLAAGQEAVAASQPEAWLDHVGPA
jgi:benzoylformate decarboxylase